MANTELTKIKEDVSYLKHQMKELSSSVNVLRDNHIKHLAEGLESVQKKVGVLESNVSDLLTFTADMDEKIDKNFGKVFDLLKK